MVHLHHISVSAFDDENVRKTLFEDRKQITLQARIWGSPDPNSCGFVETCRSFYADGPNRSEIQYCRCK